MAFQRDEEHDHLRDTDLGHTGLQPQQAIGQYHPQNNGLSYQPGHGRAVASGAVYGQLSASAMPPMYATRNPYLGPNLGMLNLFHNG
jgi:hypothetical protein